MKKIPSYIWMFCLLAMFSISTAQNDLDEKLSRKLSANFQGTSITNVLRLWSSQYNLNLVVSEEVGGRVTIQFTNVTLADALNSILKSYGYHYVVQNDIILVKPFAAEINGELESKVIKLKYLDGFQLKPTLEPLLSPKGRIEPLLAEFVQAEKGKKERETQRAHLIMVQDVWENVQNIEAIIKEIDIEPIQLQIEVRLVEVLIGADKQVGFNWPKKAEVSITGGETSAPITKNLGGAAGQGQREQRFLSGWYELPEIGDKATLGVLTVDELQATLELLSRDNNSRLVSNPRVTTLNNKKAVIQVATVQPIPEVSRGISGDFISYREKPVGLHLEVIPRINEKNIITLNVHPVLEDIVGFIGPSDFPQPVTSKREVTTEVTVREGESLAIGGLIKTTENKVVEKLWLLGDIPLLGYLFRHTTTKKEKTDLLIFITPKILTTS